MTYQEIVQRITEHRANRLVYNDFGIPTNIQEKVDEIEWALQALAEKLADDLQHSTVVGRF